jgi:PAS domain S-box-containing protein
MNEQTWESIARLASIIDSSQDAIIGEDLSGAITTWNKGAEQIYGYAPEEAIGRAVSILTPLDGAGELLAISTRIQRGESVEHYESIQLTKDGRRLNVLLSISPIRNRKGVVTGASTIARDLTEQRQIEHQLRHSQRMESLGQLAGGVAHDFNNLLMVIRGSSDLIALDRPGDERLRRRLDDIAHAADRGVSLVKQLLSFSRKEVVHLDLVDLNSILTEVAGALPGLIDANVRLVVARDKPLKAVRTDRSQVFQTIINLAVNACTFMPDGGRLAIDAESIFLDEYYARQHLGVIPGQYIMVAVSDSGIGISRGIQEKMFDPLYDTKPTGEGAGLGLSVVQEVVGQSGGHVSVYSELGIGTVVKLYFPVARGRVEMLPEVSSTKRCGTVLLAEDDPGLRKMLSHVLVAHGYVVLEAQNGLEALELAKHHRETISAIVTDIVMPLMNGLELGQKLEFICPQIRTVYMSGYSDNMELIEQCTRNGALFLPKPFPMGELVQKLDQFIRHTKAA